MAGPSTAHVSVVHHAVQSLLLNRVVKVDCYFPRSVDSLSDMSLLLINDGQDLETMHFEEILDGLYSAGAISPLFCVGIHCSADRKNEYGTALILDYKGRGARASLYTQFVLHELIPFIRHTYQVHAFREKSFAGFSLGALSALDIVWNHPSQFSKAGMFSGSFWWRDVAQEDAAFDENIHRIMHRQVRAGAHYPWLRFFFEVGTRDETADRNNNGIIDAIDDTISLIEELHLKGYDRSALHYLELQDGRHDVPTWGRAFPAFLKWGWGLG